MHSWRIRAYGVFEAVADEQPADLGATLRADMANPPRRINRFTRLALIGAHRCVAQLQYELPADTSLYLASEHGNVAEMVGLMEDILLRGQPPKPMSFVNVSSNMPGFYLAASLGLTGRNMTVARHYGSFGAMLELAQLEDDEAAPQLLGTVVEAVWPLDAHRRRRNLPARIPLVEASYWLVLESPSDDSSGAYLLYGHTPAPDEARDWLAAGEQWFIDPHFADEHRRLLIDGLHEPHRAPAPLAHVGHAESVAHALFTALQTRLVPRVHAVARDPSGGYQLLAVVPD